MYKIDDYAYPRVLPWGKVIDDLNLNGKPNTQIALLIGCSRSTVRGWASQGYEPSHSSGVAILELHTRYCGPEKTRIRISEAIYKGNII